jgi:hypothetical protein
MFAGRTAQQCRASAADAVAVTVEPAGNNARRLYAGVDVYAPVSVIWSALTDYDGLGDFIPGTHACMHTWAHGLQHMPLPPSRWQPCQLA